MCHMLIYILRKDYFPMTTNYDTTAGQPLFVCLYTLNVKTAEPIGTKFCVGHHVTLVKVYQ